MLPTLFNSARTHTGFLSWMLCAVASPGSVFSCHAAETAYDLLDFDTGTHGTDVSQSAADAPPAPTMGISDIHGLVRTGSISGDYTGLPEQTAADGPEFGYSVAASGQWLIVGAPGTVSTSSAHVIGQHGALFVYKRGPGGWQLVQRITGAVNDIEGRCGHSVAIRLPHLVTGCPGIAADAENGATEGFKLNEATQQFDLQFTHYAVGGGGQCGWSVALSANYFLEGCPAFHTGRGFLEIHKRNLLTGSIIDPAEETLQGADVDAFAFGAALALHEPPAIGSPPFNVRLAVGAPNTIYAGSALPRGSVYMFQRALDDATWDVRSVLRLSTVGSAGNELARFGAAVAMNTDQLVVGAPNNRYGVIQTLPGPGTVHRYERDSSTWSLQETSGGVNLPDGPQSGMRFGDAVAIGFDHLIAVGAPGTNGTYLDGDAANAVGLVEARRTASGDWSVSNFAGEMRPSALNVIQRTDGHMGQSMTFDVSARRLVIGYPGSGTTLAEHPNGSVWIYEPDRIFVDGLE